jgi:hypothetical protein
MEMEERFPMLLSQVKKAWLPSKRCSGRTLGVVTLSPDIAITYSQAGVYTSYMIGLERISAFFFNQSIPAF